MPSASQRSGSSHSGKLGCRARSCQAGRGDLGGQLVRAELVQQVPAEHQVGAGPGHLVHRGDVGPLALPQADHVVQGLPELDREGVVVGVNVGDEEVADIAELIADLPQPSHEPLPGLDQGNAGVDEVDALVIGDRVDIDRPQRVHGQRQGDPVHAPAEILDPRLGPCVPVRRGHAHRVTGPFVYRPWRRGRNRRSVTPAKQPYRRLAGRTAGGAVPGHLVDGPFYLFLQVQRHIDHVRWGAFWGGGGGFGGGGFGGGGFGGGALRGRRALSGRGRPGAPSAAGRGGAGAVRCRAVVAQGCACGNDCLGKRFR